MTKKASIIIPCYNTGQTISRTLRAFCKQAVPVEDYEIIVIDDCSTDDTAAKIKREAGAPQVISLRNSVNSGRALTRNRGLDRACGEIVIFSDGDTIPCDDYLRGHLESHRRYPDDHFVVVGAAAMPEDLEITPLMYLGNVVQAMSRTEYASDDPYDWLHFSTLNVSLKRRFIDTVRFDDGSFRRQQAEDAELAGFEDTELAQRLAKKGMKLVHNPAIRAFHYHFRSPDEYINKVLDYGKRFAVWISLCDPQEASELNRRMNFLFDYDHPFSGVNIKECLRRFVVNDLSYPLIRRTGKFFEKRNERLSLFFYQKLYKYLFLKGYYSK
jgi:glycosyltransferase involved in cell wall biosynthesis